MKIYVDMDQVLVDFHGGTQKILGYHFESVDGDLEKEHERNRKIVFPSFWQTLPPMPDYQILWEHVKHHNPYILSAYPSWNDPYVHEGKRTWIQMYLQIPLERVHIVKREEKCLYAQHDDKQNILIDDRETNIEEFERAGGFGILHRNAHRTIRELENILNRYKYKEECHVTLEQYGCEYKRT